MPSFSSRFLASGRRFLLSHLSAQERQQEDQLPVTMAASGRPVDFPSETATSQAGEDHGNTSTKALLVPKSDQLATFRTLTGIDSAPALTTSSLLRRPAPNLGIYARVVHAESQAKLQYQIFSVLINGCLGMQIVVAAALTALGAGSGPHGAVTAFGAINTIIAGFLTYLNGSGLPHRQKHHENEWSKVREYIEQRERDFCREGCALDLESEIYTVERLYEEVKSNLETSTTDNFVSASDMHKRRGAQPLPVVEPSRSRTERMRASESSAGGGGDKGLEIRVHEEKSPSRMV